MIVYKHTETIEYVNSLNAASSHKPHVPTWVEPAKIKLFWRNLNELSDNFSFDSEFALVFKI